MSEKICNLTFAEIKELAELVADKKLGKIDIKVQDSRIVIEDQKCSAPTVPVPMPVSMPVSASVPVAAPAAAVNTNQEVSGVKKEATETESTAVTGNTVKAPIVGTFYAAPSPEKPAFVEVGKQVKKGDVLFIIESMKLMNEIQSEFDGTVKQILVSDASAVEYDQPIMIIE